MLLVFSFIFIFPWVLLLLLINCIINIIINDELNLDITSEDIMVQRTEKEGLTVATEKGITVALDTLLTDDLKDEGFAREFVSKIQNYRRELDLDVSDRIIISYTIEEKYSRLYRSSKIMFVMKL